jgi:hypothetical protein
LNAGCQKATNNSVGETPPLSRAGRKIADAIMEAAKFKRTTDGARLVRQYEVHGIAVTEWEGLAGRVGHSAQRDWMHDFS